MKDEHTLSKKDVKEHEDPPRRGIRPGGLKKGGREILQEEIEKYKALIETTDTGYLILDDQGKVIDANKEYVRISGHSTLGEIIGRSVLEWTADYDKKRNALEVARCLRQGFVRGLEIDYTDQAGGITPVEINGTVLKTGASSIILSLCRDITSRRQDQEARRLSEEILSKAFQASPDWISITTVKEGRYLDVNDTFLRLTGYARDEVVGRTSFEINIWDNLKDRKKALAVIGKEGALKDFEVKFKMKSGETRIMSWSAEFIEIRGEECILSFCQDITQRKEAEEARRESEKRYRLAIEQSNDGICLSKGEILLEVNLKFLEIFGYAHPSEVIGKSIARHIDPLDRQRVLSFSRGRSKGESVPANYEFKGLKKNGESLNIEISAAKVTFHGDVLTFTVLRDITERKRAEDKLRDSEATFRQLAETIREIFWLGSSDWKHIYYISPAYQEIWGRPAEELYQNPIRWLDYVLEEDRQLVLKSIPTTVAPDDQIIFPKHRIQRPDGSIRWLAARAFPIIDDSGRVIRVAGLAEDITERVQAEEDLKESREHLRSLMESATDFAVYRLVHDRVNPFKLNVVFVSPIIKEIMGVADPMNFESWFETMHPEDVERVITANTKAFDTGKFNVSYRFHHPLKKEWRWIQAISTGVLDVEKQTRYVNGILLDITDKKRTEEALLEAYATLDEKVKVRTHQLQIANQRLKQEIKERKGIETDLRKSKDKLHLLSNRLINAQENERKRIAIELHDELGQSLVGLKFQLSRLEKKLHRNQKELQQELRQAAESIDTMTDNVRRLSRDLLPTVLEHLGLFEALQWLFKEFANKYQITVIKKILIRDLPFSKEQELIIFRIFQEALTNIGKHAQATRVTVAFTGEGKEAVFSIMDNGKGFNPKVLKERPPSESGLGLTTMAERAQMAGGELEMKSETGKGTLITFTIPLKRRRKPVDQDI